MAQTTLHVRMDEDMKKMFDEFCNDLGMSMSTAVCLFVKQALKEQKIPFELSTSKEKPPKTPFELPTSEKRVVSNRIGIAKGKLHVPSEFADWDKEVESLFEGGDLI